MSIKPEHANKIFDGTKKFEYRRVLFKADLNDIEKVIVYASAPVQMVIGEFKIKATSTGSPRFLWAVTQHYSGIDKNGFFAYFKGKEVANCIIIESHILYDKPIPLSDYGISRPPQSFMYLREEIC